ncbi:hypothetical protein IDJ77_16485 [Mucilaginibacter sp. ZT4R22]|uniref:Uncharacterized protein n=1 Tax=Mucilaginibacter pankratovii TaxID=2772110 RepID=A0ABR7WSX4_9SPHI|nr:hypothetical protein [Mucilaginibacter pankratovii]MBD1365413.1 hypothetical protein [Mucilaginibacter pankratovii]
MNKQTKNGKIINCLLTRTIIKLHENGFSEDFTEEEGIYTCIQCNMQFSSSYIQINICDLVFDDFSGRYKYIYTIESYSGLKGVLIADSPYFNTAN